MALSSQDRHDIAINNACLFDGLNVRTGRFNVGIRDGAIVTVSEERLAGDEEFNVAGAWLSPGLIDSHVHLFDPISCVDEQSMNTYLDDVLPLHFQSFLRYGVTTIKSVGDPVPELLTIRERLRLGVCSGPRFLMTGFGLTAPGGHPTRTIYGRNPWYQKRAAGEADSPEAARERVAEMAELGVDAIKLLYQGGCACHGGEPDYRWHGMVPINRLKRPVMEAAIEEAHRRGLKVTVHTYEQDRAIEALEAGADGVEHGIVGEDISDDRVFELLLRNDATYVPTLWVYPTPEAHRNVGRVAAAGVRVALGTDSFSPTIKVEGVDAGQYGSNSIVEAQRMVKGGLSPLEVMRTATVQAARHLGRDDIGSVAEGLKADLVVFRGNPAADIENLWNPSLVIADGKVVSRGGSV
ncbi:Amidohydrolase family protein [Sphingobium chlorophenolicum]|uniref:Amidohydrolase family protein n=2 Tax=Sphingobium chlorophenolicum TaxID=46429 RepID=A0A081RFD7_SPHCR|nr:Amidohydrolase family protein [Sphingobium chlorophenolicum]